MIYFLAWFPALWASEYLLVSVGVVLHDTLLGALEGIELDKSPPAGADFLLCRGYLE